MLDITTGDIRFSLALLANMVLPFVNSVLMKLIRVDSPAKMIRAWTVFKNKTRDIFLPRMVFCVLSLILRSLDIHHVRLGAPHESMGGS